MNTPVAFLPVTVAESAATTFRFALFRLSVTIRLYSCTWNLACRSSSASIMSRIGLNALSAASFVGARIRNSPEGRVFKIRAVSMMPAAIVDLPFFLLTIRK